MSNVLQRAMEHVESQEDANTDQLVDDITSLKAKRNECLPIEVELIANLDKEIAEKKSRLKTLKHSASMRDYPILHLSKPMEWVDDRNWNLPRLGIFRFDNTELKIRFSSFWGFGFASLFPGVLVVGCTLGLVYDTIFGAGEAVDNLLVIGGFGLTAAILLLVTWFFTSQFRTGVFPRLPKTLRNYYRPHVENLGEMLGNNLVAEYTCWLPSGEVPEQAREEINKAKDVFGEKNIFYVAEAVWTRTSRPQRQLLDPIVIGLKGDVTYLITSFDMTPLEQAVEGEFTDKSLSVPEKKYSWNDNY